MIDDAINCAAVPVPLCQKLTKGERSEAPLLFASHQQLVSQKLLKVLQWLSFSLSVVQFALLLHSKSILA